MTEFKIGDLTHYLTKDWDNPHPINNQLPNPFKGYFYKHIPLLLYILIISPYLLLYVTINILLLISFILRGCAVVFPIVELEYLVIPIIYTILIPMIFPDGRALSKIKGVWTPTFNLIGEFIDEILDSLCE